MEEIDAAFVQDPEFRPELETLAEDDEIPIIDLAFHGADGMEKLKSQISSACENWGFFQVINHGVPSELRNRAEILSKQFFHQSLEQKLKVKRDEVNPTGFHHCEHTKNVRDWKQVFDFLLLDPTEFPASDDPSDHELRTLTNQWPDQPSHFRETCQEYAGAVQKLAFHLLEIISASLGLPADRLNDFFDDETSLCRLNYYPPCPAPHLALGVGRHKDSGAITVLAQDDVGGLQVGRKRDGKWIPVSPHPDALIVNIGNCLQVAMKMAIRSGGLLIRSGVVQVWSNDRYWSAEHRVVVNTERERFSIPLFLFPSHYVGIKPLEEVVSHDRPASYSEFNWGKFFASRNRSDFQKRAVDNIQIDRFKTL